MPQWNRKTLARMTPSQSPKKEHGLQHGTCEKTYHAHCPEPLKKASGCRCCSTSWLEATSLIGAGQLPSRASVSILARYGVSINKGPKDIDLIHSVLPPLSNSWIIIIIWLYIALHRTPNIDCYWGGGSTQTIILTIRPLQKGPLTLDGPNLNVPLPPRKPLERGPHFLRTLI